MKVTWKYGVPSRALSVSSKPDQKSHRRDWQGATTKDTSRVYFREAVFPHFHRANNSDRNLPCAHDTTQQIWPRFKVKQHVRTPAHARTSNRKQDSSTCTCNLYSYIVLWHSWWKLRSCCEQTGAITRHRRSNGRDARMDEQIQWQHLRNETCYTV